MPRELGAVQILVVRIGSDRPTPALLESLLRQVEGSTLHLLDFFLVHRRSERGYDLTEVDEAEFALAGLSLQVRGLVGTDDARRIAMELPLGAWAAVVLVEPMWFDRLASDLARLGHPLIDTFAVSAPRANAVWDRARRRL
ncbi:DUF6325 family protein [Microbacterium sp. NPDC087589]|uniref:DUF6325 family protein n=1 Tax=Microbacterium sp. NPDC087589 TaxID=3364191 RepID=UPI00381EEA99